MAYHSSPAQLQKNGQDSKPEEKKDEPAEGRNGHEVDGFHGISWDISKGFMGLIFLMGFGRVAHGI